MYCTRKVWHLFLNLFFSLGNNWECVISLLGLEQWSECFWHTHSYLEHATDSGEFMIIIIIFIYYLHLSVSRITRIICHHLGSIWTQDYFFFNLLHNWNKRHFLMLHVKQVMMKLPLMVQKAKMGVARPWWRTVGIHLNDFSLSVYIQGPVPSPRGCHASALLGSKGYISGGVVSQMC